MRKQKDIKIVVHKPVLENAQKFETLLSKEFVKLIEALITKPQ